MFTFYSRLMSFNSKDSYLSSNGHTHINPWQLISSFSINIPIFDITPQTNWFTKIKLNNSINIPIFDITPQTNWFTKIELNNSKNYSFSYQQPVFINMPGWNTYNFDTVIFSQKSINTSTKVLLNPTTSKTNVDNSKLLSSTKNLQWWIDKGYNPEKGEKLCNAVKRHLDANPIQTNGKRAIRGQCVGFVRKGINDAFYNGKMHYSSFGKAYLCGQEYLKNDSNFKQLTGVDMSQINPSDIPKGAIVLYARGYSNSAASQRCGHGEVSNGNGKGYSDCLTNLKNNDKQRIIEIWLPA